jgi:CDP-diacylglycerol pyrophosphatase
MRPHSGLWGVGIMAVAAGFLASLAVSARAQTAQPGQTPTTSCVVARPPNSLWSIAQCCAKNLQSNRGCRFYSRTDDFIILKDNSRAKPNAYLIIPTTKVTGMEDPQIFARPVADFWADGWQQAQIFIKKPAAETAMAINSEYGRTQNQLHIHISCVQPDVVRSLGANDGQIGNDPAKPVEIPLGPQKHPYRVIKVASLVAASPFDLVAAMPGAKNDMAEQSIAVIGSQTPGSYYVLDTYHRGSNQGAAEELLEQTCGQS